MRDWLIVPLLAFFLGSTAWVSVPFAADRLAYALTTLAYLLLAVALWAFLALARRAHWAVHLAGVLPVAATVVWHIREQWSVPDSGPVLAVVVFASTLLIFGAHFVTRPSLGIRSASYLLGGSSLVLAGCVAWTFYASTESRWHLLRHHRMFGLVAFYGLAEPVDQLEEGHFERDQQGDRIPVRPYPAGQREPLERPHLVFVLVDTLRADSLHAHEGDAQLAPQLDDFSERAWVFGDVLSNSGWTRASVGSFFTGRVPEHHGARTVVETLAPEQHTLAEELSSQGYDTAAFVTNTAAVGRHAGFAQGFDHFEELVDGRAYLRARQVTHHVHDWLQRRRGTGPVFLYVHYLDPHRPYRSGGQASPRHGVAKRAYEAEVGYLDEPVTRLCTSVQKLLDGPVYVLFTSDHGEQFGEHFERGHRSSLYREVVHIPLWLSTPTGADHGRIDAPLEGRDFFELYTLLGKGLDVDVKRWAELRARDTRYASVRWRWRGPWHRPYLFQIGMRRLQRGSRAVIWSAYGGTWQLYDLAADPGELENLAAERPAELRRMQRALHRHLARVAPRAQGSAPDPGNAREASHTTDALEQLRALGYSR